MSARSACDGVPGAPAPAGSPAVCVSRWRMVTCVLLAAAELRQVARNGRVHVQPPVLHQQHHGRRGGDHLGQRGDVVDGALGIHLVLAPLRVADAPQQLHVRPAAGRQRRAGKGAAAHLRPHQALGGCQLLALQPRPRAAAALHRRRHGRGDGGGARARSARTVSSACGSPSRWATTPPAAPAITVSTSYQRGGGSGRTFS